ncbi:MAG: Aromatic-L-amino-acid decarboxylase [uncultured Nocardioidaceae bacterium]|uniref:Aromatic-L-amino-acid decarboxylase n=1 Tax=uncultured Nocardioidaceae bacterium TaxID=253824 RepID=A0A6J4MQM4_9ACTN|nr:MAG: Aromatic-L-amino-acid decarboxylase [uncultured Nocardioidaceae bacterium]
MAVGGDRRQTRGMESRQAGLDLAHRLAERWLSSLEDRPVPPQATADQVAEALGDKLPETPTEVDAVIDELATACEPGLTAMPSGRFFGFVIGGTHPAALATDWLVSAWDQNSGLRRLTPAHTAVEDITSAWLLDLLGLPTDSAVGFVTGGTMANFTCLAAAREAVLRGAGWDVATRGLQAGPPVRVLVGAERHDTVDLALRYLGLGTPQPVAVDDEGRVVADALTDALAEAPESPTIVVLQAGNVHSGAFDPFADTIAAAHASNAWVHVDGAFGLWAAASPTYRGLVSGVAEADSWATDAHKTLNVPYDCGIAAVRDPAVLKGAMSMHGDYLIHDEQGEPLDKVPEISRRGRAFPVWAVLRALGRSGVSDLVDRLCGHAAAFAEGLRSIAGAEVLNDVVFTQVCASFGSDEQTERVVARLLAEGTTWMTGSTWHGRKVLRISVSNWSTTDEDVARCLDSVRRAAAVSG